MRRPPHSVRRRRLWSRPGLGAAVVAAGLVLSSCARNAPQDMLEPEGPIARQLDRLWNPTFAVAVVIFFLVELGTVFLALRYRARPGDDEVPEQIHGNTALEIGWTALPALLLLVVGFFTVATLLDLSREPEGALDVEVIGHRFWWEFEYPDLDVVTANELYIPTGRPISLDITSDDVIHSFWAPKLAGKQDAVPGRTARMTMEADRPGTYLGQCTEFCGASHANMRIRVVAVTPDDFDDWVRGQRRPAAAPTPSVDAAAAAGAELFATKGCGGCHTVAGRDDAQGTIGPDLTHLASRATFASATFPRTEQALRRWLRDPPDEKPGVGMPDLNLTEEEITNLIAYLNTLK